MAVEFHVRYVDEDTSPKKVNDMKFIFVFEYQIKSNNINLFYLSNGFSNVKKCTIQQ